MVEALAEHYPRLDVSRVELDREPPSYTADTLPELTDASPDTAFWLIVGTDQLLAFSRWREPERILSFVRVAAVDRGPEVDLPPDIDLSRIDRVSMPRIDVSSSEIRRRLGAGQPVAHLLPPGVLDILTGDDA